MYPEREKLQAGGQEAGDHNHVKTSLNDVKRREEILFWMVRTQKDATLRSGKTAAGFVRKWTPLGNIAHGDLHISNIFAYFKYLRILFEYFRMFSNILAYFEYFRTSRSFSIEYSNIRQSIFNQNSMGRRFSNEYSFKA